MWKRLCLLMALALAAAALSGCAQSEAALQDGYYTAEESDYDGEGWKKFITIYVSGDTILTAEYNARDRSGFIKSWDMDYMRNMVENTDTYPNEYVRVYSMSLLNRQSPDTVEAITGATKSHTAFQLLAQAAVRQATAGDTSVAYVEIPEFES